MRGTWKPDPTSRRTTPRPRGWGALRKRILARDGGRCTWIEGLPDGGSWTMWSDVRRCTRAAVDVDHMGAPDDHTPELLRSLCEPHHDHRTAVQANAAKAAKRQASMRKSRAHPGLRHSG